MKKQYPLLPLHMDFSAQIHRHSGDETIAYKTVEGQNIHLSYFYPDSSFEEACPTLILVHGGGWSSHKIFADQLDLWQGDYLGYLARYYAEKGYVCVCIDYRLSRGEGHLPGYQLIDCFDDCVDAMDQILRYAKEHHIDTDNVSILGESAGGHLAGMLATVYSNGSFQFRRAFLVNPILDFECCPVWVKRIPQETMHPLLLPMSFAERAKYLSPICHIHNGLCPVILIHGQQDTTVGLYHSENFYQKMQEMGLSCDLHVVEGTRHAFLLAEYTDNLCATQIGVSILDSYLLAK